MQGETTALFSAGQKTTFLTRAMRDAGICPAWQDCENDFSALCSAKTPCPPGQDGRYDEKRKACSPLLHPALHKGLFRQSAFYFLHSVHIQFSRFFCGFPQGFVAANTAHSKMWCFCQWLQNDCNLLRKYCTSKGWLCYNKGRVFCIRKKAHAERKNAHD